MHPFNKERLRKELHEELIRVLTKHKRDSLLRVELTLGEVVDVLSSICEGRKITESNIYDAFKKDKTPAPDSYGWKLSDTLVAGIKVGYRPRQVEKALQAYIDSKQKDDKQKDDKQEDKKKIV